MKKITAHIFSTETCIVMDDTSEIIICNERVYSKSELQEIIKSFWELEDEEYELTTVCYF